MEIMEVGTECGRVNIYGRGRGSINVIEQVTGKASSARCGSQYMHLTKLFQTGPNVKKGSGMMEEIGSLSWEQTDRIEKALWPCKYVRVQMPERESCFS